MNHKYVKNYVRKINRIALLLVIGLIVSVLTAHGQALTVSVGDYGDAPDGTNSFYPVFPGAAPVIGCFPTRLATKNSRVGEAGIHHLNTSQEWFGKGQSAEAGPGDPSDPDGFPNLVNNDAFDDGLTSIPFFLVLTQIPPKASISFTVTAAANAPQVTRYVNMLIDWDQSGDWRNIPNTAPEWVLVNFPVNVPPGTTQTISAPIPWGLGARLGPLIFWLRMTLSRTPIDQAQYANVGGWDGSGTFAFGETEDYFFHPRSPLFVAPPWNPPPPIPPLPGIRLVPKSQGVFHGTPAYVHVVWNGIGAPPALLDWRVGVGQRGGFLMSPNSGWMPPPGPYKAGSGSTATFGPPGGPIDPLTGLPDNPAGTINTIKITSKGHRLVPPTESWPLSVKAKWPGVRVQTRKAIVHIAHSGSIFGIFDLRLKFQFLFNMIGNFSLTADMTESLSGIGNESLNAFLASNPGQAIQHLSSLREQIFTLLEQGLVPYEQTAELDQLIMELIEGIETTGPVPVPQITAPADGDTIRGTVTITEKTLSPNVRYNRFEYTRDGVEWIEIGTDRDGTDGWTAVWDTRNVEDGGYPIRAFMGNADGREGEDLIYVWVNNTGPRPIIESPANGAFLGETLTVKLAEDASLGAMSAACFEISADSLNWFEIGTDLDGQDGWSTEFPTGQLQDGPYVLKATIIDQEGNEGSSEVPITIRKEKYFADPLVLSDQVCGTAGTEVVFSLSVKDTPEAVASLGLTLQYDSSVLRYTGFERGKLAEGFMMFDVTQDGDRLTVGGFDMAGGIPPMISGGLVDFSFVVEDCRETNLHIVSLIDDLSGWSIRDGRLRTCAPPVISPLEDVKVKAGQEISLILRAKGECLPLTYLAENLPKGAVLDPAAGQFHWTPLANQAGDYPLTFLVTDAAGQSDLTQMTITVEASCNGDLNGDGSITPRDALIAFTCYLGSGPCPDCVDVNRDDQVTPQDALCLFKAYLNQPSCLQPAQPPLSSLSGQHFHAVIDPVDFASVAMTVQETPQPNNPQVFENEAVVSEFTEGSLSMFYRDSAGEPHEAFTTIRIDNLSKKIFHQGTQIHTLGEIFPSLTFYPGIQEINLFLDFTYPISLEMGPVLQLQPGAAAIEFKTDKGNSVESYDDGDPNSPDVSEAVEDQVLRDLGLKDKVTRTAPPSDGYDCHGWTFACGSKWINNDQVQKILDDNGYTQVTRPAVGDIVVYRDADGNITHTGLVRAVDSNGNVTVVESKWGRLGRYRHAPNDVPPSYGTPSYYRTQRQGRGNGQDPDKERHTLQLAGS